MGAPVVDGVIQYTNGTTDSIGKQEKSSGNTLDKDAFLQLLVAQMKYQDPLEPTSNTEYISQYATFSELEQMQNVSNNVNLQRASGLVGKNVYVKTTNTQTGQIGYMYGMVDFVQFENGKAYLSIKGNLYSMDDLDSVVAAGYEEATDMAYDFVERLKELPAVDQITLKDKKEIDALNKIYNEMTDYQKEFLAEDVTDKLKEYTDRLAELEKAEDDGEDGGDDGGTGEGDGGGTGDGEGDGTGDGGAVT